MRLNQQSRDKHQSQLRRTVGNPFCFLLTPWSEILSLISFLSFISLLHSFTETANEDPWEVSLPHRDSLSTAAPKEHIEKPLQDLYVLYIDPDVTGLQNRFLRNCCIVLRLSLSFLSKKDSVGGPVVFSSLVNSLGRASWVGQEHQEDVFVQIQGCQSTYVLDEPSIDPTHYFFLLCQVGGFQTFENKF